MNVTEKKPDDVAVFFDFENIVYALRNNYNINANFEDLMDKCKEFGRVVVAHAFADWNRHSGSMTTALISNGMDPVYVPTFFMDDGGKQTPRKNAVDMYMAIDAMDVLHNRKSVDTFILLTGDSDFVPLVNAIRREGNRVIAIGVDGTTSSHLAQAVDEFILYSQISNIETKTSRKRVKDPFEGLVQAVKKLQKQKKSALLPNVKMMMAELMGGFDEKKHTDKSGRRYQKFKEFVQDAERKDLVKLITTGTVNEIFLPDQEPTTESYGNGSSKHKDQDDHRSANEPADIPADGLSMAVAFNILIEAVNRAAAAEKSMRPPSIKSMMKEIYPEFDEKKIITDGKSFSRFGEFTAAAVSQGLIKISGKGPKQKISLGENVAASQHDGHDDSDTQEASSPVEEAAVEPVTLESSGTPDDIEARLLIIETLSSYQNYPASFLQVESYCRQLRNKKEIELSSTRIRNLMTEVTRNLQLLKRVSKPGKSPSQYKFERNDEKIASFLGIEANAVGAVLQGAYSLTEAAETEAAEEVVEIEKTVVEVAEGEEAEPSVEEVPVEPVAEEADVAEVSAEEAAAPEEETPASETDTEPLEAEAVVEESPAEAEEEASPEPEELTVTGAYRLLMSAIAQNKENEKSLKLRSVKGTMVSLNPTFDEKSFKNDRDKPFKSFIEFVRAAARDGIVLIEGKGPKTEVFLVE